MKKTNSGPAGASQAEIPVHRHEVGDEVGTARFPVAPRVAQEPVVGVVAAVGIEEGGDVGEDVAAPEQERAGQIGGVAALVVAAGVEQKHLALAEGALEFQRIDLEIVVARARVSLGIGSMILVGKILELHGPVRQERIIGRPIDVAASLLVARIEPEILADQGGQLRIAGSQPFELQKPLSIPFEGAAATVHPADTAFWIGHGWCATNDAEVKSYRPHATRFELFQDGSPVPLATIKTDKTFAGWDLLRIGRLSVVPVPDVMWERLLQLAAAPAPEKASKTGR